MSTEITEEIKEEQLLDKPDLYKRMLAAAVDFIIFFLIFAAMQTFNFFVIYKSLGYQEKLSENQQILSDSHLFLYSFDEGYQRITDVYNESLTPEENYDTRITYFYSTDERALSENKLITYNEEKITSGLFKTDENNEIIRTDTATDTAIKEFLEEKYLDAIEYLESSPTYIANSNYTYNINQYGRLISVLLSTVIPFLVLPLCLKYGSTLGQLIFKISLASSKRQDKATKSEILLRYVVLTLFLYICTSLLYIVYAWSAILPITITLLMMCFTKSNNTFHDYISHTYLVKTDSLLRGPTPKKDEKEKDKKKYGLKHV